MGFSKREKEIDALRNIVLDRYEKERPEKKLTPDLANQIYWDLLGVYDREGFDAAKERAETAKLNYIF